MTELSAEKYAIYCKLTREFDDFIKGHNINHHKWSRIEKYYGIKYLLEQTSYDMDLIEMVLKNYYNIKNNSGRQYRAATYYQYCRAANGVLRR